MLRSIRETLGCLNSLLLLINSSIHDCIVYQVEINNDKINHGFKAIKEGFVGGCGRKIGNGEFI